MSKTNRFLTCITGPMFAGKTTKLLQRIEQEENEVLLIKPELDYRYGKDFVSTHFGKSHPAVSISDLKEASDLLSSYDFIAIDEIQFFQDHTLQIILDLKRKGKKIILSGLEKDYLDEPFGILLALEANSNEYIRLKGKCNLCNNESTHTFRKQLNAGQVFIGATKEYEALCKECYEKQTKYEKTK